MKSEQGFVRLDAVVMELLAQLRQTTLHKYVWMLNYLLISYRKHLYSTIPITKICTIDVGATKTAQFPDDFIGKISVSVQNGDRLVKLFEDQTINRVTKDDLRYTPSELRDRRFSAKYFDNTADLGQWRGQGIDDNGAYKMNLATRCFEFAVNSRINIGDTLVLEYISNGFEPDTETLIYLPAAEFLKAHAMYQFFLWSLGAQSSKTEGWRITYLRELAEYKAITSNLGKDEILAAMARTASIHPKF